jgi:predicted O-methyltransferase YrrM
MKVLAPPLLFIATVSGAAVMALEMGLMRQVAPHLGQSMPVWAVIIAWVLVALAAGAVVGGRVSMRAVPIHSMGTLLGGAGTVIAVLAVVGPRLLGRVVAFRGWDTALASGAALVFYATLVLVALVALASVTPVCIRAATTAVEHAGAAAGRVYAASTIGSLIGTLLPPFVSLPLAGTRWTLLGLAFVCLATGLWALRRVMLVPVAAVALLVIGTWTGNSGLRPSSAHVLYEGDTHYYHAVVLEGRRRELKLDAAWAVQSVLEPGGPSTHGPWQVYLAGQYLRTGCDTAPRSALIIGLGAGTLARDLTLAFPGIAVTGIEIDAALVELGRRLFDLPASTKAVIGDGRTAVQGDQSRYDLIFIDAYHDMYLPFHLATAEYFELLREHLAPGGVIAANVLARRNEHDLLDAIANTMASVFDQVGMVPAEGGLNHLLFAWQGQRLPLRQTTVCLPPAHPLQRKAAQAALVRMEPISFVPERRVLRDDCAPVELLTHRLAGSIILDAFDRLRRQIASK